MRHSVWLLLLIACGTTPNHPPSLGDCSKQPCTVPNTGGGTTPAQDSGLSEASVSDTGIDTGVDSGVSDTGTGEGSP